MLENPYDITGYMEKIEVWNAGFKEGFSVPHGYALVWIINRNGDKQRVWKKIVRDLPGAPEKPKTIEEETSDRIQSVQKIVSEGKKPKKGVSKPECVPKPKTFVEREGFDKEIYKFPDGINCNVRIKKPEIIERELPKPSIPFEYTPNKPITSIDYTGEPGRTGGGINVSAIIRFEDGSKAFVKKDLLGPLTAEYGISKMFHDILKGKVGFVIPESYIGEAGDFDQIIRDKMSMEKNETLIYNDFVKNSNVLYYSDKNILDKIKDKDMIEVAMFSFIIGDADNHAKNVMVDNEGKLTTIDAAYIEDDLSDHDIRYNSALVTYLYNKYNISARYWRESDDWFVEHKQDFIDTISIFKSIGIDNILESYRGHRLRGGTEWYSENILRNWDRLNEFVDDLSISTEEREEKEKKRVEDIGMFVWEDMINPDKK